MIPIHKRIDDVVNELLQKIPSDGLLLYDDKMADMLEQFLVELFNACCDETDVRMEAEGYDNKSDNLRLYLAYGSQYWLEAAEKINSAKIKLKDTKTEQYFTLDERGFVMLIMDLPKSEWGPFTPYLNELIEEERKLHPEYITGESRNLQPEIKLTTSQFEDIVPVDKLYDRQLLAAYFETYDLLQIYRGFHDYDDKKAKELAVRMELIIKRLVEFSSEK